MSYRLEWVDLPEPAASARIRAQQCSADECPHTPDCHATYSDLVAPYGTPYALLQNLYSMSVVRGLMRRAGMVYHAEHQPFPVWPFASIEEWDQADAAERDAYNAIERIASAQTVPGMKGIPDFKTLSNGPWIVGPQEIREALEIYNAATPAFRSEAEADPHWPEWLDWLRATEQHGGFYVN